MTPTTGTILIAKDPCEMSDGSGEALIVGKEYPIKAAVVTGIIIKSEIDECHLFSIKDMYIFFTIKTEQ